MEFESLKVMSPNYMRTMIYVECTVKCLQEDFGFLVAALHGVLHPYFSSQFSALPEAVWKCQHGFCIVHLHTNAISLILHSSCLRETMILPLQ
ncbi:hypothetical protein RchiOBHm_Chr6g0260641 [Rosa chinensis]|uniref:Uncharacterized protein n=1 Tax=Rosa chinensis TaxID=74649 RepID=A0A2P6PN69_ROSCH|nr:hypothetical protein RchiOBHm_Chr6g0260641 [Rosa chinensis]